jgi:hypothetical protein
MCFELILELFHTPAFDSIGTVLCGASATSALGILPRHDLL